MPPPRKAERWRFATDPFLGMIQPDHGQSAECGYARNAPRKVRRIEGLALHWLRLRQVAGMPSTHPASRQVQFLRDVLTADPDFTFVLPGSGEVVGKLHSQPCFRRAAECLG
jgi:hypothetical protein